MYQAEIAAKKGAAVAQKIVEAKENDVELMATQVRISPDMHGVDSPDTRPVASSGLVLK